VPKVIVLFFGSEPAVVRAAEAAAAGAQMVRFTEVDLRSSTALAPSHKALEAAGSLREYHGIVLVSGSPDHATMDGTMRQAGSMALRLDDVLSELAGAPNVADMVLGIASDEPEALGRLAQVGGITVAGASPRALVGDPADERDLERARATGFRVAKVTGWVRHGLGHEAAHHHAKV